MIAADGTKSPDPIEQLNYQVSVLQRDMMELRKLVDTLVVLVDPEDVKAALELPTITPPNSVLREYAKASRPPVELLDVQEEKPW